MEAVNAVAFVARCRVVAGDIGLWCAYRRYGCNNDRFGSSVVNDRYHRPFRAIIDHPNACHDGTPDQREDPDGNANHGAHVVNDGDCWGASALLPIWNSRCDAG